MAIQKGLVLRKRCVWCLCMYVLFCINLCQDWFRKFGEVPIWWLVCRITRRQTEVCVQPWHNPMRLTGLKVQTNSRLLSFPPTPLPSSPEQLYHWCCCRHSWAQKAAKRGCLPAGQLGWASSGFPLAALPAPGEPLWRTGHRPHSQSLLPPAWCASPAQSTAGSQWSGCEWCVSPAGSLQGLVLCGKEMWTSKFKTWKTQMNVKNKNEH